MVYVYRFALGDFDGILNYSAKENDFLYWVLFVGGTILMMIILLNMIIAVMSISYETIIEECDAYLVREKLSILLDMDFFIKSSHD
eukprot:CAMPEP_0116871620 /NCGR_PEP_ID=MMETSP0463-20121206/2070_1 /TAXON_ID=181622 /ORGANISM="Strombidinopsis sp, Strain SopsisLIS2011" /LENGTH=85 /DNA_ID=CAMNT_0004510423 /DNA_START=5001 /DNA_END=5258 /DNA_ORIENTATION=+